MSSLDNAIAEAFETANTRIKESFELHASTFQQVSAEFLAEIHGWQRGSAKKHHKEKALPYEDHEKLMEVQRLGIHLFRKSMTATNIHRNLNNYIIGSGHTYDVKMRPSQKEDKNLLKIAQQSRDRILSRYNWLQVQNDFYNRWFRSGDIFRNVEPVANTVDFGWIEPFMVRPPITGRVSKDVELGIEFRNGDYRKPEKYYIAKKSNEDPKPEKAFAKSQCILHSKTNVDMNDPRGLPLLWLAYVPCMDIDAINSAMTEVAKAFARFAVVKQFSDQAAVQRIKQMAADDSNQQLANRITGHIDAGEVEHAKGYEVKLNATDVNARDWAEMISIKARMIGSIANLPEFMVTGDADTGNRSSLLSAETPFTTRVIQESSMGSAAETDLFYLGMQSAMNTFGDRDEFNRLKTMIEFVPAHPIYSTLRCNNSERLRAEVDAGFTSVQMACAESGRDYEQVQRDRVEHIERESEIVTGSLGNGNVWGLDKARFEWQINALQTYAKNQNILGAVGLDAEEDANRIEGVSPGLMKQLPLPGVSPG